MPIYEYICLECKAEFESIRPMSEKDKKIECDRCGGKKTKRKLTVAAKSAASSLPVIAGGASGGSACGSCAGGDCGSCGR